MSSCKGNSAISYVLLVVAVFFSENHDKKSHAFMLGRRAMEKFALILFLTRALKCRTLGAVLLVSLQSLLASFTSLFSYLFCGLAFLLAHVHKIYTPSAKVVQQLYIVGIPYSEA